MTAYNPYIADQIVRQRVDSLTREAAAARRSRRARQGGRARRAAAEPAVNDARHEVRIHVPSPGWARRPLTAVSSWIAAGQL